MPERLKYRIVLLDRDGYEIAADDADALKEARQRARYLLSEEYARAAETTHARLGTHKAEIRNGDECVADFFYR